jgi:hypothetical protein
MGALSGNSEKLLSEIANKLKIANNHLCCLVKDSTQSEDTKILIPYCDNGISKNLIVSIDSLGISTPDIDTFLTANQK